ncbi:MAG: zinc ABC transporter substrate-binding protein [Candidatus Eisenbacteria bacterium]|nr:zinc ABC transporter substrate-binding protein [Candidatus Eisenbacteria bacterium]
MRARGEPEVNGVGVRSEAARKGAAGARAGAAWLLLALCLCCASAAGRTGGQASESPAKTSLVDLPAARLRSGESIAVVVGIPPQAGIVRAIGGERVRVDVLVQPGQEPHTFEASPRQIAALLSAKIYFRIGLPFEDALLAKIGSSPSPTIVDMGRGAQRLRIEDAHPQADEEEHATGTAGPGQARAPEREPRAKGAAQAHESELDPHLWLSPRLLPLLAQHACEALQSLDPGGAEFYAANLATFVSRLQQADARAAQALAPYRGRAFFVYHPAFGYFAEAYGLRQVAVEHGGKEPSPKRLAAFLQQARAANARTIFVQPQFDRRAAETMAQAIGGTIATLDDLAEDPLANLEAMAARIVASFEEGERETDRSAE